VFRIAARLAGRRGSNCVRRPMVSGFQAEFGRARSSLPLVAAETMVRLRLTQRRVFGEKLLDLANFAAAALVFGQFVGQQPAWWSAVAAGVAVWFILTSAGLWLMRDR